MYTNFIENNLITLKDDTYFSQYRNKVNLLSDKSSDVYNVLLKFEGCSFNKGEFRFHTLGSSYVWTIIVCCFFNEYKNRIVIFAFDWMGRQYGTSLSNRDIIYVFDSATGKVFELEQNIYDFLNVELVDYKNELLNELFYIDRIDTFTDELPLKKSIGFRTPLFLGGKDEITNYELVDTEVYWELNYQIIRRINNLPDDTLINKFTIQ